MSSIPASTGVGAVHLRVMDTARSSAFYRDVLGLEELGSDEETSRFGAGGRELVVLHQLASRQVMPGRTGLYHLAIVVPNRKELARVIARLIKLRYPNSPTDHVLTKADYLWDPDGNGIEVYAETPEDGEWGFSPDGGFYAVDSQGRPRSGRDPIDLDELFSELQPGDDLSERMPAGTKMGHVHLHVRDIAEALDFYSGVIGFDLMGRSDDIGMAFVSAGGYHHHLGLNTWAGQGALPAPTDAAGLVRFTIEVPDPDALDSVAGRLDDANVPLKPADDGIQTQDASGNRSLIRIREF